MAGFELALTLSPRLLPRLPSLLKAEKLGYWAHKSCVRMHTESE